MHSQTIKKRTANKQNKIMVFLITEIITIRLPFVQFLFIIKNKIVDWVFVSPCADGSVRLCMSACLCKTLLVSSYSLRPDPILSQTPAISFKYIPFFFESMYKIRDPVKKFRTNETTVQKETNIQCAFENKSKHLFIIWIRVYKQLKIDEREKKWVESYRHSELFSDFGLPFSVYLMGRNCSSFVHGLDSITNTFNSHRMIFLASFWVSISITNFLFGNEKIHHRNLYTFLN